MPERPFIVDNTLTWMWTNCSFKENEDPRGPHRPIAVSMKL